jgi:hypothetical protein
MWLDGRELVFFCHGERLQWPVLMVCEIFVTCELHNLARSKCELGH